MEGIRNVYTMSVGKLKGKRPLRRPRHRRKSVMLLNFILSMHIHHTRVQWRNSGNMVIPDQLNDYQLYKKDYDSWS
jgi:hypothetical protein